MKARLKGLALGLLLALPVVATAAPADEAEKRKVIAQIMQKLNMKRASEMQMSGMIALVQRQVPQMVAESGVPAPQRERATQILRGELGTLQGQMIPIILDVMTTSYARTFTLAELKELLAFYNTSTGIKLMQELPRLRAEGMKAGEETGKRLFEQATCRGFAKLRKEGISPKSGPTCK